MATFGSDTQVNKCENYKTHYIQEMYIFFPLEGLPVLIGAAVTPDTSHRAQHSIPLLDQQQRTSLAGAACQGLAWNAIPVRESFPEFLTSLN